jgi:phage terminase large subunit-like protein
MTDMNEFIMDMDRKMSAKSFQYFFTEILGFDYSDHHKSWDEGLEENRYYCVKASRDHGKSVFFMSYALWIAAFQPNTHVMIFSHSLEQTLEHMRFIRNNIEGTPILRHLIPEGRPWRKTYFEFNNGSRMMAKSTGGGTRGFHPNVVVCDDILWGTTGTELQRAADWFYGVLLPVLHHTGRLMMVGTPFSYNDLYSQLEQTETFTVETYPAINEQGEALWPERWDLDSLEHRRLSMPAIQFSREYLCEPIHDVASMFPNTVLENARNKELVLLDRADTEYNEDGEAAGVFGQHFIGWDTAIASDKNADFTAMVVLRTPPEDNIKQIVGVFHEKGVGGLAQKKQILLMNNRFQPDLIELEGNNFQRMFAAELQEMRNDIPIKTFMTTRQRKESMFMSLLMAFEQGQIQTPYGDKRSREFTHKLETELNRFGMQKNGKLESVGTHDDLAMALALANWATKEFKGSIVLLDDVMPGFDEWLTGKPHRNHKTDSLADGWMIP